MNNNEHTPKVNQSQLVRTSGHLGVVETDTPISVPEKIAAYLERTPIDGPALIVDLDLVEQAFGEITNALPGAGIFYAVKANPAPAILRLLDSLGAHFDVASRGEIEHCLAEGIAPERLSYGTPLKKVSEIQFAHQVGVRLFSVDCEGEIAKVAEHAPGAEVLVRMAVETEGAEWPLARKFGAPSTRILPLMKLARAQGLHVRGLSFHVGSQQTNLDAWDMAIRTSARIYREAAGQGFGLNLLNIGGGVPVRTHDLAPHRPAYVASVMARLQDHFGTDMPQLMMEPGRGLVAEAGVMQCEVVTIAEADDRGCGRRWVYLDIGKFTGLAETLDESIRYCILTPRDGDKSEPCVIAGPTCDSTDTLYEQKLYSLPVTLQPGDKIWILSAGAYTTTYASVGFNGFKPPETYCI